MHIHSLALALKVMGNTMGSNKRPLDESCPPPPPPPPLPLQTSSHSMPSFGILGLSAVGILGCGVMAGVYRAKHNETTAEEWRKLPPAQQAKYWKRDAQGNFNPTRFAGKALAVGTVLCLGVTGVAAFALGRAMGVSNVHEFAERVRVWAPAKRRQLEAWLNIKPNVVLEEERRKVASMSYDEEMDYWADKVMAEEEKEKRPGGTVAAGGGEK